MNRISRLLHRASFLSRQRLAVRFSDQYVISQKEAYEWTEKEAKKGWLGFDEEKDPKKRVMKVLDGFNPN